MKTPFVNLETLPRRWYLLDADGQTLGRLAARIASILRGKERPYYTPHQEVGDFVVVINAHKIRVSGTKVQRKLYHHYSGYPGGLRTETFGTLISRQPHKPLEKAIKGMLPKGPLGRKLFGNVKVYVTDSHPHEAQKPEKIEL